MPFNRSFLKSLFSGRPRGATSTVPAGERIYAIGDIHGCAGLLTQLHDRIAEDMAARGWARNHLVYMADYIDRGPDSRKVMALVQAENPAGFAKVHLRGNHEAMLLEFLENPVQGSGWLHSGGDSVLREYGISAPPEFSPAENLALAARRLASAMLPGELKFIQNLNPCYRSGGYLFVHAGVQPDTPLESQSEQNMIWIRKLFLNYEKDFAVIVVHGHAICNAVDIKSNRIGIDTGAHATGKLTCLILERNNRWLLQTGSTSPNACPLA